MVKGKTHSVSTSTFVDLPLAAIRPNPWQARRVFGEPELCSLAESISEVGQIQPVIVRIGKKSGEYQLVAGERRLRAHHLLARATISAVIVKATDEEVAAMALAENIKREDLTDFEVALAIRNIDHEFSNRSKLAKSLGIQRSDLYRYMAFFQLPDFIQADLEKEPKLLGRAAASNISATIKDIKDRPEVEDLLSKVWTLLKSHKLDQAEAAESILAGISGQKPSPTPRDVKNIYAGGKLAARLVSVGAKLTVEIRTDFLPSGKETQLRKYIEELFVE